MVANNIMGKLNFVNMPSFLMILLISILGLFFTGCSNETQGQNVQSTQPNTDIELQIDFDKALRGVNFDPATIDGNGGKGHSGQGNGILDAVEMALVAQVLNDQSIDRSGHGGVSHGQVNQAFAQALESASSDLRSLIARFPTAAEMATGYVMIGTQESFDSIEHMSAMFGGVMDGDYSLALELGQYFGPEGDADGDGFSNIQEYNAFYPKGRDVYITAALNPKIKPTANQDNNTPPPSVMQNNSIKTVGIVLYPGFEVLDVYGPLEMWGYVREFNVIMIAEKAGPVVSAQGAATVADFSFEDAPMLDIIMLPGGVGTTPELENETLINFIKTRDKQSQLTTSICTGAALLAKAGILDGYRATTNKRFFYIAERQGQNVHWITDARWVSDGKYITSSGVSAGTDMALGLIEQLYGKQRADAIASSVEYEWNDDPTNDPFTEFTRRK